MSAANTPCVMLPLLVVPALLVLPAAAPATIVLLPPCCCCCWSCSCHIADAALLLLLLLRLTFAVSSFDILPLMPAFSRANAVTLNPREINSLVTNLKQQQQQWQQQLR
jgi:hypothetical protein